MSDSIDSNGINDDNNQPDDFQENINMEEDQKVSGTFHEKESAEKSNKLSLIEKEKKKRKPEKTNKTKKEKKKKEAKTRALGFRGRLSLGFLLFVLVFTSLLYLNLFLNTRVEKLREERIKILELVSSWEKLISITNRLASSTRLATESTSWEYYSYDFDFNLKNLLKSQIIEDQSILSKHNNVYNIVLNLLKNLNLNGVINISMFEEVSYTEEYQNQFKTIEESWKLGSENLNKIKTGFKSEFIIRLIREGKPLLVKQTELTLSGNTKDTELKNFIYEIEKFFFFSEPFSYALKTGTLYMEKKLNNSIDKINLIMTLLTTIVSIVALIFTLVFFSSLQRTLINPLQRLIKGTDKIGRGDLTGSIKVDRIDEIGTLTSVFNATIGEFRNLIQQVYVTVIVISKILRTLFKSSKDVKESGNAQATTIEQTRGNFESLNWMIKTISEETTRADKYTTEALDKVKIGTEAIENLEKEMIKIESSSEEITNIIELINDIAEQTELLSLNASIEAARAGEAGKGFSVVASEVKKLAERSTHSANRIYELITNNTKIIQTGVNYSRNTAKALREIAMANEVSAGIVKTINVEAQNIQQSSNEVLGVINYIAEIAQVNLMEIENVANATEDLGKQAVGLQRFVGQFDVRPDTIKENELHIEAILKVKLDEFDKIFKANEEILLPTGKTIEIKGDLEEYNAKELKLGNFILTGNNDFVDMLADKVKTAVTFFQNINENFIRVATTIQNYDDSRAIGTKLPEETDVFKKIIKKEAFFGRVFIVNRWYISVYSPIVDKAGSIIGVINLGIPEEAEFIAETKTDVNISREA